MLLGNNTYLLDFFGMYPKYMYPKYTSNTAPRSETFEEFLKRKGCEGEKKEAESDCIHECSNCDSDRCVYDDDDYDDVDYERRDVEEADETNKDQSMKAFIEGINEMLRKAEDKGKATENKTAERSVEKLDKDGSCAGKDCKDYDSYSDNLTLRDCIEDYIINEENGSTTIVWSDGKITTSKVEKEDTYDPMLGIIYCCMEYFTGGKRYLDDIRKILKEDKKAKEQLQRLATNLKEDQERDKRKQEKNRKRKEKRKRDYDVKVVKEALLQLKEEGLL